MRKGMGWPRDDTVLVLYDVRLQKSSCTRGSLLPLWHRATLIAAYRGCRIGRPHGNFSLVKIILKHAAE